MTHTHTAVLRTVVEPPALYSCCDQCFFRCPGSWASSYLSGLGAPKLTPLLCGCRCICPLSSHSPHIVSLFWFIVICSYHLCTVPAAVPSSGNRSPHGSQHSRVCFRGGPISAGAGEAQVLLLLARWPNVFLFISSWSKKLKKKHTKNDQHHLFLMTFLFIEGNFVWCVLIFVRICY